MRIAGLKRSGLDKPTIVDVLESYLLDEKNIEKVWNSLNPYEKEYLDEFLKYDETPNYQKMQYLHNKHGVEGTFIKDPSKNDNSAVSLLFMDQSVPPQIKGLLLKYLTPVVIKYDGLEQLPVDEATRLNVIGESFAQDFSNVIHLANRVKLELTKKTHSLSKSAILQIDHVL